MLLSVTNSINASHPNSVLTELPPPSRASSPAAARPCQPGRVMGGAARDYSVVSHNGAACQEVVPMLSV